MTRRLLLCSALIALAAVGCRTSDTLSITPWALAGTWDRVESILGNGEEWKLTLDDGRVTGTGSWAGEACCGGALTVTGYVSGDSLHVDVTSTGVPVTGVSHYHFDGVLRSGMVLVGPGNTPSRPNEFRKVAR